MYVIGLTGGVGSGKSAVADVLVKITKGESLISDELGHIVMEPGTVCHQKIVERFGKEVENADGTFCKEKLAALIFQNPKALAAMNGIVHPAVKRYIQDFLQERQDQKGIVVLESAILFETHCEKFCDETWFVHVPEEVRVARLMQSRGYSKEKAQSIIARQLREEDFKQKADYVFNNHGTLEELPELLRQALSERNIPIS